MNANELRIGNWALLTKGDKSRPVSFASFLGLANVERSPNQFAPIPLTPEILERAGFGRIELISALEVELNLPPSAKPIIGYEKKVRELTLNWVEGDGIYLSGFSFDLPHVLYLHQLQNLYYALTGEELQIEL